MSVSLLKARLTAGFLLCAALSGVGHAQEPSPSLKEADADYRAGVAALSHHDLNAALADFQKVVHLAPTAEQGHSALGAVLVQLGRTSEGIRELEKALAMKPSDSSAQLNLALAYEHTGEAAKALPLVCASWRPRLAPKSALCRPMFLPLMPGRWRRRRQFPAAVAKMQEAVAGDPQNAELQDELGSLYAQRQDWAHAREAFTAAIQANPDLAMAHLHLGMTLDAEQQPGRRLDELTKAYQLAPQNPVIALQYGQSLAAAGEDEHAIPILQHALELDPNSTAAAYQLGLALQRTSKVKDAIPLLQRAATAEPKNAEILTNLGMALCQAQQAKDAVPILQRAVALTPDNVTAHQNLAAAYIQLSQFDDAVSQLNAALKLSPDAPQLHYNLGLALKMKDDAADAIPELEIRRRSSTLQRLSHPMCWECCICRRGGMPTRTRELNISLKLRPENGDGWATLGSVDNHLDKLPEAEAALKEAIRQLPQQPDPHLTLAAVLAKAESACGGCGGAKEGGRSDARKHESPACRGGQQLGKLAAEERQDR